MLAAQVFPVEGVTFFYSSVLQRSTLASKKMLLCVIFYLGPYQSRALLANTCLYIRRIGAPERERDREEEVDEGVRFFSSLSLFSWNQGVSPTPFLWLSIGRSSKKHQVRNELARRHLCGVLSVAEAADSEQKKQRRRHVPRRTPTTVARLLVHRGVFRFFFFARAKCVRFASFTVLFFPRLSVPNRSA